MNEPGLTWLHIVSETLTAAAYFAIPVTLFYYVRKRVDTTFNWVMVCFGLFLLSSGVVSVLEIYNLFHPAFLALGVMKAITAFIVVPTALMMWLRFIPTALQRPSVDGLTDAVAELQEAAASIEVRAKTAIERAETPLKRLSEAGLIGLTTSNLKMGGVVSANDMYLSIVGYTRDDLEAGRIRWASINPPEYAASDRAALAELAATGIVKLREKEYLRPDGSRVPVLVGGALVDDESGDVMTFVLDLTERKRAEATIASLQAAREADETFRGLLESAPDAMVIVDAAGAITLVNGQTENLFGYSRGELIGQPVERLIPNRFKPKHPAHRDGYFQAPKVRQMGTEQELTGLHKDGHEFPVEVSLSPLETPHGLLVSSAIRDVTARKATEAALRTSNRELEAFSYSVAHDLRTPLRGISGFAKILNEEYRDSIDDEGRLYLSKIQDNAIQMAELIDALLSLARVSRAELHLAKVDATSLAQATFEQLQNAEPEREVHFTIEPNLTVNADPTLTRMLVENLIGNAWKFTKKREASAFIEVGSTVRDGHKVAFVRDNGAGFDMAHSAKLFTAFQRLHAPREFPGTGVGLATCHRVVERHGGRIWAEAEVSKGATFYFWLPEVSAGSGDVVHEQEHSAGRRQ